MNRNQISLRVGSAMLGLVLVGAALPAVANERLFTYTYEPETMVAGATEIEQWVTLRAGRTSRLGQGNFHRWDMRTELEHGITDSWQAALYLNYSARGFRDGMGVDQSEFDFKGVSIENVVNIVNPANHAVGVSLYGEVTYSGEEAEVEAKILLGQRHGDWKWALNLFYANEWEDNLREIEGEFGVSFGLTRRVGKNWHLGFEARNINKMPEYEFVETSAIYVGPVVSYRAENWWATLTVMPQVFGRNWDGVDDGRRNLDLAHNERVHMRLLVGFDF